MLSSGLISNVSMKEIEILPEKIPKVIMPNLPCSVKISISHTDHVAISTAIIIDKSENVSMKIKIIFIIYYLLILF